MSLLVRVADVASETPEVRTLRLVREDGENFAPYQAGAHIDVIGPTGVLRQYSLCSPPGDPSSWLIAVKRETDSRGGSSALHQVTEGDRLKIGNPRSILTIAEDATEHVLIAGGIGVTPLLSMAYELWRRNAPFTLHYFARSRDKMAFRQLLEHRAEFADRVELHPGITRPERVEILTRAAASLKRTEHVYTCGPAPFMDQVASIFAPFVGEDHVHIERFTAQAVDNSTDKHFTVEVDGENYEVPADKSILGVLEENGIEVFKSCQEGICGSCVSGVLAGIPDHRDHCLSPADRASNKEIALCVSRAKSDKLTIELY